MASTGLWWMNETHPYDGTYKDISCVVNVTYLALRHFETAINDKIGRYHPEIAMSSI